MARKVFKAAAALLGLAIAAAGAYAAFVAVRGIPTYAPGNIQLTIQPTPRRIARGEKLVRLLCAECHASERQICARAASIIRPTRR